MSPVGNNYFKVLSRRLMLWLVAIACRLSVIKRLIAKGHDFYIFCNINYAWRYLYFILFSLSLVM
ncbi:hypothetical protein BKA69DRAFT_1060144 [Paraphysoderma sedebokerense]|nr:hypothetical protein BKA69DRAFT_1060020 [Paraphysoderma sedebokerense]KAI9143563.1 hypothetical protein BKA69DRAFT_1060144 [Paraphysoderma sedebokerense]